MSTIEPPPRASAGRWRRVAATFFCVAVSGCAGTSYVAPPLERRQLGEGLATYQAPLGPEASASEPPAAGALADPTGALGLADALALALQRSPDLASFSWKVRVQEARALQAGLRPNPELELQVENFAGADAVSGFDAAESTFLLSQRIETAGKRPKRRRAAELAADVASWEYEAARLDVFASIVRAFVAVLAAQERVALSADLVRISESSAESVARLVGAGATPPAERTRAALETATAGVELASARHALEAARRALAATWGSLSPGFDRVEGDLAAIATPPDEATVQGWLERNPELVRWEREITRRQALVEVEDSKRIPDVVAGIGSRYLSDGDDPALVAQLAVPLPIFDRNQGERAAARRELHKAEYERRALHARLAAGLASAYQELAARHEEVTRLRAGILPGAREAFEQIRQGYLRGLFRAIDVLDAERQLFELRLREIEALRSYHEAKAEVERLTGTPLDPRAAAP